MCREANDRVMICWLGLLIPHRPATLTFRNRISHSPLSRNLQDSFEQKKKNITVPSKAKKKQSNCKLLQTHII